MSTALRRAAIVSPLRTPVAKYLGALSSVTAGDLGAVVIRALVERTGVDPSRIDDVVFAQGYANGEAPCIARWSSLAAGLPIEVPGVQLDRRCGSGLQAVIDAAMRIQTGAADVVIAGGCESMSNVEYYTNDMRKGARAGSVTLHDRLARGRVMSQPIARFGEIPGGMIETAENLARDYQISREECDEYALLSHQRAAAAWDAGKFEAELVPVDIPQRKGAPVRFDRDEGVRGDVTAESLAALRPIEKGGVVTAGNASQQNDAAAACLVVAEDKLEELGLTPVGWFVGWAAAGCEPSRMGIGPVPAVKRLFERTGFGWDDIDLVELNEAFAAQSLPCIAELGLDPDRVNVNGGAIALGHPLGCSGARLVTTLLHELSRRNGRRGLATMCIGVGQGITLVIERG